MGDNLELEAADGDLRNDLFMKDEKIAHLKEELGKLKAIAPQPTTNNQELLTQAELSKQLGCYSGTLTKNRPRKSMNLLNEIRFIQIISTIFSSR